MQGQARKLLSHSETIERPIPIADPVFGEAQRLFILPSFHFWETRLYEEGNPIPLTFKRRVGPKGEQTGPYIRTSQMKSCVSERQG